MPLETDHDICVDEPFRIQAFGHNRWCHMWSDSDNLEALHQFASRLGLKRSWFQDKPGWPHYDLAGRKHEQAIALGARLACPYVPGRWRKRRAAAQLGAKQ